MIGVGQKMDILMGFMVRQHRGTISRIASIEGAKDTFIVPGGQAAIALVSCVLSGWLSCPGAIFCLAKQSHG